MTKRSLLSWLLAPRRQEEIAAVVARMSTFRPTLVAVEARTDAVPSRALIWHLQAPACGSGAEQPEAQLVGSWCARDIAI